MAVKCNAIPSSPDQFRILQDEEITAIADPDRLDKLIDELDTQKEKLDQRIDSIGRFSSEVASIIEMKVESRKMDEYRRKLISRWRKIKGYD